MASLPITGIETHPTGTINPGGIINGNWQTIENIFDPAHVGAQAGVLQAALAGMTTITYAASINVDLLGSRNVNFVALAGALTIVATNKGVGRQRKLIIVGDGTPRAITVPVGVIWAGPALTTVPAGAAVILTIVSTTTADSGLVLAAEQVPSYSALGIVPKAYGGAGADVSAVTFPTTGTIATLTDITDTLNAFSWKDKVRAKTTANVNLASGLANGTTHDGVTLATGDRVLVASQTAPAENGIYVVPASGAASRSADANSGAELVNATLIVSEGTVNEEGQFTCNVNAPIVLGTTALTFVSSGGGGGGGGTYTNGTGLTLTGNVFAIDTSVTADLTTAQLLQNKSLDEPRMESIHAPLTGIIGFAVEHVVGAVNIVVAESAITGSPAIVRAEGTDPNVNLSLAGKGTGVPIAPTASPGTNTTQVATCAFVLANAGTTYTNGTGLSLAGTTFSVNFGVVAALASPTFTGTPAAPTASPGTNTTQLATTAFVFAGLALKADLASPALTGTPTAPTASPGTNTTQVATTAFVTSASAGGLAIGKILVMSAGNFTY